MSVRETILGQIEAFMSLHGMSERRFGMLVCKDHKLVDRLRRDSVTLARIEAAERFMREYVPPAARPGEHPPADNSDAAQAAA